MGTVYANATTANGCFCCGNASSNVCYITLPTLLRDFTTTPYADVTEAQAAIDGRTAGCLIEYEPDMGPGYIQGTTYASVSGTVLSESSSIDTPLAIGPMNHRFLSRCYLTTVGLNIEYGVVDNTTVNYIQFGVGLYQDDANTLVNSNSVTVYSVSSISGSFNFTIPNNAYYYISTFSGTDPYMGNGSTHQMWAFCNINAKSANASFCSVRAVYDDAGSNAYLICV